MQLKFEKSYKNMGISYYIKIDLRDLMLTLASSLPTKAAVDIAAPSLTALFLSTSTSF